MCAKPTIGNEKAVEGRTFDKEHLESKKNTDPVSVEIEPHDAGGNGKSGRRKILSIYEGLSKLKKAIGVAAILLIFVFVSVAIYLLNVKGWSHPLTPVIKPPTYLFNSSYEAAGNPVPSTTTIHNQPVVDSKNEVTPFVSDDDVIIETPALAANTDKAFGQLPSDPAVPVVLLPGYTPSISSESTISTTLADDNVISEWPEVLTIPVTEQDTSGFVPVQTEVYLDYEQEQSTDSQTEAISEMVPAKSVDAIPAVDTAPWKPIDGSVVVPPVKKEYKVQNRSIVDIKSSVDSQRSLSSDEKENRIIKVETEDRVRTSKPTVSSTSTEPSPSNVSLHSVQPQTPVIKLPTYTFHSSYKAAGNPVPSTTTIPVQPLVESKNEATPFVPDDDVINETPALAANTDEAFGQLQTDPAITAVLLTDYTPSISSESTISTTLADDNVISEWPEESTIPVTEQDFTSKPTVSSTSTEPFPSNVSLHSVPASSQCIRRQLHFCRGVLPYLETTLPNFVGDTTERERNLTVPFIESIVESECHPRVQQYACAALEPPCRDGGISLPPCRQFCHAVAEGCNDQVYWALNYSQFLNCTLCPESNDPNVCFNFLIPGGNETD
ncbi:hypothetical protein OUZ56_019860 [Daphnia magna]|uniref:FZ domain-containing protein n=1 Tax=Daphnia magna TaxID=35525 RepID=A0ABQ9ZCW2_9CRUS|nr:hypothetical protein OUZ56_019860 [Daphnia magna]